MKVGNAFANVFLLLVKCYFSIFLHPCSEFLQRIVAELLQRLHGFFKKFVESESCGSCDI